MLYATTRGTTDIFTPNHAIFNSRASNGGLYIPFHMSVLSQKERLNLQQSDFHARVAFVLKLFFGIKCNALDCEFAVGRHPVSLQSMGHKCVVASCCHNLDGDPDYLQRKLAALVSERIPASDWVCIAVRIALLWGLLGGMKSSEENVDLVITDDDEVGLLAAIYGQKTGLPIQNVVVCCEENASLWQLIHKGEISSECIGSAFFERLADCFGGSHEVKRYLEVCSFGGMYTPSDRTLAEMRKTIRVNVVGNARIRSAISAAERSEGRSLEPRLARCTCGLTDYRAMTGENRMAMILQCKT